MVSCQIKQVIPVVRKGLLRGRSQILVLRVEVWSVEVFVVGRDHPADGRGRVQLPGWVGTRKRSSTASQA